jgi:CHAT domain-containing protein/lipopolysaccharide biosynthesis regulator YciM
MSFAFRVLYSLALCLSLIGPAPAQSQSSTPSLNPSQTPAEAAVRAVAERYFALYASKDLDGLMTLWSAKSPELEAHKKSAAELFASSGSIALKSFAVQRVSVAGDKARVRVEADVQVFEAKTGKEKDGYGRLLRTLEFVREPDGWKVVGELATYDELAGALFAARIDEERAALLRAEAEMVTPELSLALGRLSDRLRSEKQYPQALAAAQLAIKLAEQLNARAAQGSAWEQAGRAYAGLRDYGQAAEHFRRGLILFEELGDKQTASSLLGRMASCYYHLENYQAALETNLRRLKLKEELNDREWMASTLDDIALSHYRLGNFQAAQEASRRAIPLYEELGNSGGVARVLMLLGDIQLDQSDYEQAIATYERAGAIFAKNGDAVGPVLAALNVGQVYGRMGDYGRALDAHQKALAGFTEQKNANRMALALSSIGGVYSELGDYEQARDYFRRSLQLYEEAKRPLGRAEALSAIGNSYRRQGNYARALDYLHQGLKLFEEPGRKFGLADALTELGDLYLLQGDENLALEFYQRSQTLFEELGGKDKLAALVGRRGTLQQRRGNYQQALAAHEQSLALYRATGNKSGMAEALASLGDAHLLLKQPERALASYRESQTLFEEMGNRNGVAQSRTGIARVEQARGNHPEALSAAERAQALADKTGNLELLWQTDDVIGRSRLALKQTAPARQAFERAAASIEMMRAQAASGELARRYFLEHRLAPYHSLIELQVGQGRPREALAWAERSKARVLLDVMQSGRADARRSMTAAEQQQERGLRAEIISLNTQVTRASQSDKPDQAKLDGLKSLREKARLNYEAFQTSLYGAHPELRVQRGEAPVVKAEELAALLPADGGALLEYVVTDEATYLFGVTRAAGKPAAEVRVFTVPVGRAELAERVESFRKQLAGRDLGFRAPARQLYQLLLEPAQALLRGKTGLVIVPDDKLWELPFQALLAEGGRYVIETSAVSYAPSLTVLREMTAHRGRRHVGAVSPDLLALGNPVVGRETVERARPAVRDGQLAPLPEAEQEVKALGQMYGAARSKVYVGAEAREDRVKAEAATARVIHFATHGTLNNGAPMYSHLVLAQGDAKEDGLLEAWELMQMDLRAELAVLSACDTARGRVGAGEGMIGLTWALFVAGVPTTVVSQWQVESASTRDLMVSFHRGLNPPRGAQEKATKSEALRQAALKLLRKPETAHPFYWAGFVLVGDDR